MQRELWKCTKRPEMVSNGNFYQQLQYLILYSLFPWSKGSITLEQRKGNAWFMTKGFPHHNSNLITQKRWTDLMVKWPFKS